MINASLFSSLDHATSFVRQLWFNESRIQSWLDALSGHRHLTRAIGHAPATMMKELLQWDQRYIAKFGFKFTTSTDMWFSQKILDEVKVNIHVFTLVFIYVCRLSRSNIQETSEELGEVVLDSMEKEDVVSSYSYEETESAGRKASMLSYDLNKISEENEYPYS
ncbi:hypothetical protein Ahy_B08g089952 [Arachis hypogaea]|uniref:Oxo-4-hydroxy-4-carboxy-5-ureidoimidazoline decarboxylase domain-containing protein n=1 Tax=Arachis hypogaea TaxID=3818 RepID=A0A444XZ87_ARAHY|nr:hypothetical protein Ahy_B08g089952 [Arachis hypogaea]